MCPFIVQCHASELKRSNAICNISTNNWIWVSYFVNLSDNAAGMFADILSVKDSQLTILYSNPFRVFKTDIERSSYVWNARSGSCYSFALNISCGIRIVFDVRTLDTRGRSVRIRDVGSVLVLTHRHRNTKTTTKKAQTRSTSASDQVWLIPSAFMVNILIVSMKCNCCHYNLPFKDWIYTLLYTKISFMLT